MNHESINNDVILRYFSGNDTEKDLKQLLSWVNENPENEQQLFILKDIYESGLLPNVVVEARTEEGWRKLQKTIARSKPQKNIHQIKPKRIDWTEQIRKYAAIFMIGVLLGLFTVYITHKDNIATTTAAVVKQFEISTEKGERATISLPDGSKVVLNACSFLA